MQICGTKSGREIDKAKECGITPEKLESGAITFAESRLTLDCRKLFKTDMKDENFVDKYLIERFYNEKEGGYHTIYIVEIENFYTK